MILCVGVMNMMKPLKTKINVTIDSDIVEKIKIFAEEDDRTLSGYINKLLRVHVKRVESKTKLV